MKKQENIETEEKILDKQIKELDKVENTIKGLIQGILLGVVIGFILAWLIMG